MDDTSHMDAESQPVDDQPEPPPEPVPTPEPVDLGKIYQERCVTRIKRDASIRGLRKRRDEAAYRVRSITSGIQSRENFLRKMVAKQMREEFQISVIPGTTDNTQITKEKIEDMRQKLAKWVGRYGFELTPISSKEPHEPTA